MDKKFMGIIAGMLVLCIIIMAWAGIVFKSGESSSTTSTNNYSAAYIKSIFDKNKVQEIRLTLAATDFNNMMQNPQKEEYKEAAVTVNGVKVENVGFRVKGNSSLSSVANSNSKRFSFKLDFDHYIDGQNLDGLSKLNLNNSFSDPSYMREYLSYSLLDEMGVPTPAYSYANIYVNGELLGLYLAVEGIEESFLTRYYGSNYGNLYKPEGTGSDLVYKDDNMQSYSGVAPVCDLKNGADAALLSMLKALDQGKDLEKYLNVDEILRYFAVNTVLVNMDSYQGNFKHNYYLYEKNGIFSILPWDYNMSFGGFGMGGGNSQNATSLYIDQPVSGTTLEQRPLLGKLLEVPEYKELYHQYINEFINGPFAVAKMNAEITRLASMIRPHLEKDPTKFSTMEQFEQAIAEGAEAQNAEVQPSAVKQAPDDEQIPVNKNQNQVEPDGKDAVMGGRQRGDGMMQGNTNIGLAKFVRERIESVKNQLSGKAPAVGNTAEQSSSSMMRGQPGDGQNRQMPPGGVQLSDGIQPPNGARLPAANIEGQGRPDFNGGPVDRPDGAVDKAQGTRLQNSSIQQLYLLGGSLVLLLCVLLLALKGKNKYSV
ncbi:MAG: CotH kinase family protein [Syntrophomonadaceae bacterium]|nr:CotH kinase family protein [Syntrophomonadaceae bacterium]